MDNKYLDFLYYLFQFFLLPPSAAKSILFRYIVLRFQISSHNEQVKSVKEKDIN
jgi:hypothetical protein